MAGPVPAIPIGRARRLSHRDHRHKAGDDVGGGVKGCGSSGVVPAIPMLRRAAFQAIGITGTSPVMTSENVRAVPEQAPETTLSDMLPSS
jgi:hypothetical protein